MPPVSAAHRTVAAAMQGNRARGRSRMIPVSTALYGRRAVGPSLVRLAAQNSKGG